MRTALLLAAAVLLLHGAGAEEAPAVQRMATPDPLKCVYMTSWVASGKTLRQRVIDLAVETEVNGIIIDVKDDTGRVCFPSEHPTLVAMGSPEKRITDLPELIAELHALEIYTVARIAVFQDPYLAKARPDLAVLSSAGGPVWEDRKGLSWVDPGSPEVWEYVIAVAREAHALGFDEINFDYIRFPSDGNLKSLTYTHSELTVTTKAAVIESFFAYVCEAMEDLEIPISADLFGMTTHATDDMNIGQVWENALPYFDYVAPMVYPSHYPANYAGHKNPNAVPYEIVKHAMDEGVARAVAMNCSPTKIRPWLQDFDYPVTYTAEDVKAQMKAVYDSGLSSWFMWDPSNKYTRSAYE